MDDSPQYSFRSIGLPDGTTVELALPVNSSDPVVNAYASGIKLNEYLVDLLLMFTQRDGLLLDLGCHVGTLSVPAAALGRRVLAVDASPMHVESIRLAAERNHLDHLRAEWCAIDRREGEIEFNENGLWGMVSRSSRHEEGALRVKARRADALIQAVGWQRVDLVKMDVEGSELAAIESLGQLLNGPDAPVIIYESNGMTFELFGYTITDIRLHLEELGYKTYRFEAGRMAYCDPMELQPEAWLDLVALPPAWQKKCSSIVSTWTEKDMVRKCVEWGTNEHRNVRQYLHRAFASRSSYPRNNERIVALRAQLAQEFGTVDAGTTD
jgi:FkbM family methyltransferase